MFDYQIGDVIQLSFFPKKSVKILSCGAGMQSTALALMSCENKIKGIRYPLVPIYDVIIFCDLGGEPEWVYKQVAFIKEACALAGIPFHILSEKNLYADYITKFGESRVVAIPFWSIGPDGKKAIMRRNCTLDYKVMQIQKFVKYHYLNYKKHEKTRKWDIGAHEMHIGFSIDESDRAFKSLNPMYVNKYPLIEMKKTRADNYRYVLEVWGLETKASACIFCPFHRNYFYYFLKHNCRKNYDDVVRLDSILEEKQHMTPILSRLFISRSRKRIEELREDDCVDAETFVYKNKLIWNGF